MKESRPAGGKTLLKLEGYRFQALITAVWGRTSGKSTLKLAVRGAANRNWWREMLQKLTALPNCHAVGSLQARLQNSRGKYALN